MMLPSKVLGRIVLPRGGREIIRFLSKIAKTFNKEVIL